MIKIKDGEVRPEGCICEPYSDIPPNWNDIRTKFGYIMLGVIGGDGLDRNFIYPKGIQIFMRWSSWT